MSFQRSLIVIAVLLASKMTGSIAVGQRSEPPPVIAPPSLIAEQQGSAGLADTTTSLPDIEETATSDGDAATLIPELLTEQEEAEGVETASFDVGPGSTYKWYHFAYWFGPTPWDIGFELGINGTQGTNEAFSFRTGGHVKRETKHWKFKNTLVYNKNTANSVETQNNSLLDVRVDRKLAESPWSLYFLNQELYDEFQAFDLRASVNTGVGYKWIDTETLDLVGRFGAGASREFGGPDDTTKYEALFGLEYDHEISKTQRLSAKLDYFPEWEDFGLYRIVTDIGWEIDLDRPSNTSLKFSVIDRYDSTPNGFNPNEVNYSALLIWGI